ncbi:MAG TPA: DUF559 domain-containing protein [Solirubrobacteraceae bacterium]|nr:DUF559 domain-containing protein [Solirubrobacteraceae bacterium]
MDLDQLLIAGLGLGAINHRVRAGRLYRMHRRVFAVGHRRLSQQGRQRAALLALGDSAALSHVTAAVLWQLILRDPAAIHVTVPTSNGPAQRPGIVVHRCTTLTAADVTSREGFAVTSVARTLLDLAGRLEGGPLQRAVERSLVLQCFDRRAVTDIIDRNRRTRGATALANVIASIHDEPRLTRSALEALMLDLCVTHHIDRPEVNARIAGHEVDFLWRAHRLIVETDGHEHHGTRTAFERDRARDAHLTTRGYRVVRFTYRQVLHEPDHVARTLLALLRVPLPA